ncbi:MAG: acetyl-CoA C-acetyltransferase, partial [Aeromicrobium sp.]
MADTSPANKTAKNSIPTPSGGVRPVAVIGGNRIPFARSNTVYTSVSNQDMLTAALDGLVQRHGLE